MWSSCAFMAPRRKKLYKYSKHSCMIVSAKSVYFDHIMPVKVGASSYFISYICHVYL